MSKQILFNNATAVPAADATDTDPSDVAAGRIAAFDVDNFAGGTLALNEPLPEGVSRIQFVQGGASGEEPILSPIFNVEDIKASQLAHRPYLAPVAQVSTVTCATGTGIATIRVVQVNTGFKPHQRITAEVNITGKTAGAIATEFANKINAVKPSFLVATTSTADLVLTGNIGVSFETSKEGSAEAWTLAATTAPRFGSGTAAHVRQLEEEAYGANFINRIYLPVSPPQYAQALNYDLFTISIPTNTTPNISRGNKYFYLYLAVQATATGIDLEEFFFGDVDDEE